jgi:glycogen synthase
MEEEAGTMIEKEERTGKEEIFSKIVRAGKRTYFFDVKATRKDDYYLTITESKKRLGKEGKVFYEKHKIFLYKEDFEKFSEGLKDAVGYIDNGKEIIHTASYRTSEQASVPVAQEISTGEFTNIDFDDLGKE